MDVIVEQQQEHSAPQSSASISYDVDSDAQQLLEQTLQDSNQPIYQETMVIDPSTTSNEEVDDELEQRHQEEEEEKEREVEKSFIDFDNNIDDDSEPQATVVVPNEMEAQQQQQQQPPKKPSTAYFLFAKSIRSQVTAENPTFKITEVAKEIGRRWKELSEESKKEFMEQAAIEKAIYVEAMKNHNLLISSINASKTSGNYSNGVYNGNLASSIEFQNPDHFSVPISQVKSLMKKDPDTKNIQPIAVQIVNKAVDLFISLLTSETLKALPEEGKRRIAAKAKEKTQSTATITDIENVEMNKSENAGESLSLKKSSAIKQVTLKAIDIHRCIHKIEKLQFLMEDFEAPGMLLDQKEKNRKLANVEGKPARKKKRKENDGGEGMDIRDENVLVGDDDSTIAKTATLAASTRKGNIASYFIRKPIMKQSEQEEEDDDASEEELREEEEDEQNTTGQEDGIEMMVN